MFNLLTMLKRILFLLNLLLFGLGSFLCFIIAVTEKHDRFLVGGIFLLLITFANQKIIYYIFKKND